MNYRKDFTLMYFEDGINLEKFKDSNPDESAYNISLFKYGQTKEDFRQPTNKGLEKITIAEQLRNTKKNFLN